MTTIFVSIASYRDEKCSKTLESLYSNASNPQNIYVGICEQNDTNDGVCEFKTPSYLQFNNQIRRINIPHYEAKGPTWARYLCATLFNNEDFFLQIDSHTLFVKDWDTKIINMYNEIIQNTDSKKIVLSHYPKSYEEAEHVNQNEVPVICKSFFNERGMISFLGAEYITPEPKKYIQTPYIAAGMFFAPGSFLREVPFDPHLDYLFVGEEILHSARAWTSGYDIYSPHQNIVFHLYTRAEAPKIWTDKTYTDNDAFNKVKLLLDLKPESEVPQHLKNNIDKYGLGKARSLGEFYEFAGINLTEKRSNKNFCNGKIENFEQPNNQATTSTSTLNFTTISISLIILFIILIIISGIVAFNQSL
jgi:hypothetical protein